MIDAPETSELQAFVSVADAGSISAAASELGLPRATVSRRLQRLEERLGVRLVHRSTRRLHLSQAGEELHHHARSIVTAVGVAAEAVRRDDGRPRGLLRVSTPPLDGAELRGLILDFAEQYPEVKLELITSTRHEDLIQQNIDVAWRAGTELDPGLVARKLALTEVLAVASPAYLAQAGPLRTLDDLDQHDCLLGFTRGERPATHWPLRSGGRLRVRGRMVSNDIRFLLDGARRGLGVAMLPALIAAEALRAGEVVRVLPELLGASSHVALVYPERRLLRPAVRAFVDFAVDKLARSPLERMTLMDAVEAPAQSPPSLGAFEKSKS